MTLPAAIDARAARGRLALVVDDAAVDRDRVADILHGAGWQVEVAGSGREALEMARARPPDIIFLDIVMPGMDGFEACRRLADDPRTRAIPIVFVSTKSQRADHLWVRMQGGRELIAKPFTAEQLLGALRHAGS
jgi:twitching motility two-component system response regulator PilH